MEKLNFEVSDARIERLLDETTCLCEFRVITEGSNRHSMPIDLDVIKDAAERTLRGKPILASYSKWHGDLESHKKPEESERIGYFVENQEFQYKKVEDNKTALFAKGLLWKHYSPKQIGSLFSAENHTKKVSMEIRIKSMVDAEDDSKGIASFDFLGLAILGDRFVEASPLAHATLLTFEAMKERYETMLFEEKLKVDNSRDVADMGDTSWGNPGRKLYGKFIDSGQAESIAKEAYLVVKKGWKDSPSDSKLLGFPHHRWKGDTLIVVKKGIQAAYARYKQGGGNDPSIMAHIRKHYKELELEGLENFSTDFEEMEDKNLDEKVMMEEMEPEKEMPKEEEMAIEVMAEEKPAEEEKTETPEEEKKEEEKEDEFGCHGNMEEYQTKLKEYSAKIQNYEAELTELRKFKKDTEDEELKFNLTKLFSEVKDSLSKEQFETFEKRSEDLVLENFSAFSNEVKAATFDVVKKNVPEDAVTRMAISAPSQGKKKSVWGFNK